MMRVHDGSGVWVIRRGRPLLGAAGRRWAGWLLAASAIVVAVPGAAFAGQTAADGFDRAVDSAIFSLVSGHEGVLSRLTWPGTQIPAVVISAVIVAGCLISGRLNGAVLAAAAVPVAGGLDEWLLKPLVHRTHQGALTYPSGHITTVVALAATVTVLLAIPPQAVRTRVLRVLIVAAAWLAACVVAFAVIGLRWHYFTDTVAGAAVGIGTVCGLALLLDLPVVRRLSSAVAVVARTGRVAAVAQARERDRDREQEHLDSRQREAEEKTAEVQRQVTILDEVLTSALAVPPLSFERLKVFPKAAQFDPGPLGRALPVPEWGDFAPAPARGLSRFLGGAVRYRREAARARALFAAAQSEHRQRESARRQALAAAKVRYDQKVTEERARAAARNTRVSERQSSFVAGDAESVEWFVRRILDASRYPEGFPRERKVAYRREDRGVTVEFELPAQHVVPSARAYRYVRTRDVIEPVPRPDGEIGQLYGHLIACIALRTLHEIFGGTPPGVVDAVTFDGRVATVDPATGKPAHPHVLSVSAERSVFGGLVLAEVDPAACLTHLGASVAPVPFGEKNNAEPFIAGSS